MNKRIKNFLKYVVMLFITAFLLWLSYTNINVGEGESRWEYILAVWAKADKPFLFLSAAAAILSHVIRAERWKLLLFPMGHRFSLLQGFMSVMVGYFINLVIPRGGEVSRCYNLYRLNKTPVDVSLGTVVAERVIDLIFLIILIAIAFLIELDTLVYFFQSDEIRDLSASAGGSRFSIMLIAGLVLFLAAIYLVIRYIFKTRRYFALRMLTHARRAFRGLKSGVMSVFRLEKRLLFIAYSLAIWILYYLMMYFVMLAFPETDHLGLFAALTIFVIGGIAMAVPLPGGAGSFHVLVPLGLILLYSLPENKAGAFTFIFHAWQTIVIIVVGALSLIGSQLIRR
jgi:uncharacterized protein (TIRG00374 family)